MRDLDGRIIWTTLAFLLAGPAFAQEAPRPPETPRLPAVPPAEDRPLPIDLPAALQLAGARPIDIAVAAERVRAAAAQLDRANVLWLPTIYLGTDYARHDGQIQDVAGKVFTTSKGSFMLGAGPSAVFAISDALYAPLAARQNVRARQADAQAAQNDSLFAVAEAYFTVQQARGELAGAADAVRRSEEVVRRAEQLAPGLAPAVEANRARSELARRRQSVETAAERWQTTGAELSRLLRLDPTLLVEPAEPPHLRVNLIDTERPVDDLIPVALTNRPELASRQAQVQATLARLKQERIRPLVPSVLLRGNATNPAGTLSSGVFGGGLNNSMSTFNARNSIDLQIVWEFQNLGLGNRAAVRERQADSQAAVLELFRTQDRVAAEVAHAHAQTRRAANRLRDAEVGLREAIETADKNIQGMTQTRRAGELLVLVFRPQEVVAAVAALEQSYRDYYGAVGDLNRAQFRLYRALGHPAQCIGSLFAAPPGDAPTTGPTPTPVKEN
jgi:outer membrane protein TolC